MGNLVEMKCLLLSASSLIYINQLYSPLNCIHPCNRTRWIQAPANWLIFVLHWSSHSDVYCISVTTNKMQYAKATDTQALLFAVKDRNVHENRVVNPI